MNLDVLGDKAGFFHQRANTIVVMKNQSTSMTSFKRATMPEKPAGESLHQDHSGLKGEYREGLEMQTPTQKKFIKRGPLRWATSTEKMRDRGGSIDSLN
jgi:hypothetical protein